MEIKRGIKRERDCGISSVESPTEMLNEKSGKEQVRDINHKKHQRNRNVKKKKTDRERRRNGRKSMKV